MEYQGDPCARGQIEVKSMPKIEVTNEERRALGRVLGLAGITDKDHKTIGALYIKITDAVVD